MPFPGIETCDIIEVEVQAHIRRIQRTRYRKGCECPQVAGIITASPAPRLIPKSPFGVSGGVLSQSSGTNIGEGSVLDQPVQDRHQPRKGASFGGRNERQRSCRSLCSTNAKIR